MTSDWYRRAFATRLSDQRQAVAEFETTAQGCRLATSVGGVLTGRGADLIITDDGSTSIGASQPRQEWSAQADMDHQTRVWFAAPFERCSKREPEMREVSPAIASPAIYATF
jgi:hypothetical protein